MTVCRLLSVLVGVSAFSLGCGAGSSDIDETSASGTMVADRAADPEAAAFADYSRDSILFWTPEQQINGYRNTEKIFDTRVIHAGERPFPLEPAPHDFSGVSYEVEGVTYTLDDYVRDQRVAGLLVVKGGKILLERYSLGNTEDSRWISFSIAKSVTSMLVGAAILDGHIESVDEPITRYLPNLAGGGYDGVSIRNVLQMASGVAWNEDYADPTSDVATMPQGDHAQLVAMQRLERVETPGEHFNYNTGETNVAGALVRAAIGGNLSAYLEEKVWQPFGMESDAVWMLHEPDGGELGGCCISATLRDYARIGLFAMRGGELPDGSRVLPAGWMTESTTPSAGFEGYGYLWWLGDDDTYAGIGIFGQLLWMDPTSNLVIVTHSAWPTAVGQELSDHRSAFLAALAEAARHAN